MNYYITALIFFFFFSASSYAQFLWDENPQKNQETIKSLKKNSEKDKSDSKNELRVLWWNVEQGLTNRKLGNDPLNKNLKTLADSEVKPDLIILGEYTSGTINPALHKEILKKYPYVHFLSYNSESQGVGILAISKVPMRATAPRPLDWVPDHVKEENKMRYREKWMKEAPHEVKFFTRQYYRLQLEVAGKTIEVIPMHSLMPWEIMMESWGFLKSIFGKIAVGGTILSDDIRDTDPLSAQFRNLKREMQKDFGKNLDQGAFLLVGDFNVPMKYQGKSSKINNMFSNEMTCISNNEDVSFPSASAEIRNEYKQMRIDHAFVSKHTQVSSSQILELKGSDHYPQYLVIKVSEKESK